MRDGSTIWAALELDRMSQSYSRSAAMKVRTAPKKSCERRGDVRDHMSLQCAMHESRVIMEKLVSTRTMTSSDM